MIWPEPMLVQEAFAPGFVAPVDPTTSLVWPTQPCAVCDRSILPGETRGVWRQPGWTEEVYDDPTRVPTAGAVLVVPEGWTPRVAHFWCQTPERLQQRPGALRAALRADGKVTNTKKQFREYRLPAAPWTPKEEP